MNADNSYNVYFLADAQRLDNVPHGDIKLPLVVGGKCSCNVEAYVGKMFFDEGGEGFEPGEFEVVGVANQDNNFLCKRVGSEEEPEEFDMGYTIRRINIYELE